MREGRAVCLGLALLARAASAIPGRWNAARGLWRDPAVLSPGGLPFPHVSRMDATQRDAMARMKRIAEQQSEEATPRLLAVLGSQSFRALLTKCCNASALPGMSPRQLLDLIRSNVYASELVHNCDGSFDTDVTIEIGMNATEFFPSTWQLRFLEYYGPRFQPGFGFPTTPENSAEEGLPRSREHCARTRARASHGPAWTVELQPRRRPRPSAPSSCPFSVGIFGLPLYTGPWDEPTSWAAASSRVLYIALNSLRVDAGNPAFGNLSVVFSPGAFWSDAVAAAPMDTGMHVKSAAYL